MQFKYLKHDLYRYFYPNNDVLAVPLFEKIKTVVITQGIWAIVVYRFRRWCLFECKSKLVRKILNPFGLILQLFVEMAAGILVQPEIDIGPGFYIGHYGTIFLGGNTKIGKFFNISQGCTVGYAGRGDTWGLPEIGDFVYLGPGSKVVGKVKLGNYVAVGANAVVTKDCPDDAVVGGIPAKIINMKSSRDFVCYNFDKNIDIL